MRWKNTTDQWGWVAKFLHWGSAGTIVCMYVLGVIMINLPLSPAKLELFIWHKSIGITLLCVALLRIAWRWYNVVPALPNDQPNILYGVARAGHVLLYCLLVLMPLSGWVINSAANFPLSWFGLFDIPPITGPSPQVEDLAKQVHLVLAIMFGILILGHAAVALFHHKVLGDRVLQRML